MPATVALCISLPLSLSLSLSWLILQTFCYQVIKFQSACQQGSELVEPLGEETAKFQLARNYKMSRENARQENRLV